MPFIGDSDRMIVHNAWLETRQCKLNEIDAKNRELFSSLKDAHKQGYENCQCCIGGNNNKRRKRTEQ